MDRKWLLIGAAAALAWFVLFRKPAAQAVAVSTSQPFSGPASGPPRKGMPLNPLAG